MEAMVCGITTDAALYAALDSGTRYVGFVFDPGAADFVTAEKAGALSNKTPSDRVNVGLFSNPSPDAVEKILLFADLDMIHLDGDESLQEVQAIKARCGLPVIKTIRAAESARPYEKICDWLCLNTQVGRAALQNPPLLKPWMLAGDLNAETLRAALDGISPHAVCMRAGANDPEKIRAFVRAAAEQK